jgi:hypothetical protein
MLIVTEEAVGSHSSSSSRVADPVAQPIEAKEEDVPIAMAAAVIQMIAVKLNMKAHINRGFRREYSDSTPQKNKDLWG